MHPQSGFWKVTYKIDSSIDFKIWFTWLKIKKIKNAELEYNFPYLLEMRKDFIKIRIQRRSAVVQGNVKTFVSPLEMEVLSVNG